MSTLASAYVQILPTTKGIQGNLEKELSGEAGAAATAAGAASGTKFTSKFGGVVKKGVKVAGAALAGFGIASAGVIGKSIKDTASYGDQVDKMSQKIGFSAEEYQKWSYVMERAGTSVDSMAPAMKTLSKQAAANSAAFQQLGISQEELASMSQGELFTKTLEQLSGMEDKTQRTALASQLLGRGATELGPLMNGGTQAIKEQMDMAERYGMVMSDEAVKASADFVDAQTTLSMTMKGFKNRVAADYLPAVTQVTNGLAQMAAGDMSGFEGVKAGIADMIKTIVSKIPSLVKTGGKMVVSLIKGITKALPKLADAAVKMLDSFSKGGSGQLGKLVSQGIKLVGQLAAALLKAVLRLIPPTIKAILAGIIKVLPVIVKAVPQLFKLISSALEGLDWAGLGRRAFTALKGGIMAIIKTIPGIVKSAFARVKSAILSPIQSARSAVSNAISNIKSKFSFSGIAGRVRTAFNSVKEALTSPITKAKETLSRVVDKIKGFFPLPVGKIFSGLKLPKISASKGKAPWGILGKGEAPKFSIKWNAQAMDSPYTFSNATLFGAGEAGDEILYGRQSLMDDIRAAVGSGGGSMNIVITLDGNTIGSAAVDYINGRTIMMGTSPITI